MQRRIAGIDRAVADPVIDDDHHRIVGRTGRKPQPAEEGKIAGLDRTALVRHEIGGENHVLDFVAELARQVELDPVDFGQFGDPAHIAEIDLVACVAEAQDGRPVGQLAAGQCIDPCCARGLVRVANHLDAHRDALVAGLGQSARQHRSDLEEGGQRRTELQPAAFTRHARQLRATAIVCPDQVAVVSHVVDRADSGTLEFVEPLLSHGPDELDHADRLTLRLDAAPAGRRGQRIALGIEVARVEQQPVRITKRLHPGRHRAGPLPGFEFGRRAPVQPKIAVVGQHLGGERLGNRSARRNDEAELPGREHRGHRQGDKQEDGAHHGATGETSIHARTPFRPQPP